MSGPDMSSPRAKNLALALLALTQFVVVIDASITNVALPSIGKALDISQDDLSWVVNSYTLVFGGFLLLGGRLADFFGRRACSWSAWHSSAPHRWPVDLPRAKNG